MNGHAIASLHASHCSVSRTKPWKKEGNVKSTIEPFSEQCSRARHLMMLGRATSNGFDAIARHRGHHNAAGRTGGGVYVVLTCNIGAMDTHLRVEAWLGQIQVAWLLAGDPMPCKPRQNISDGGNVMILAMQDASCSAKELQRP